MMRTNRPGLFQGEGDLLKPIEFNLAFGLYIITVAAFLPLAGFMSLGIVIAFVILLWGYATLALWPRTVVRMEQAEVIAHVR